MSVLREGREECLLCGDECESVSHVLRECPAYNICRSDFTAKLQDFLVCIIADESIYVALKV